MRHASSADDLLLFRAVAEPRRRTIAARLLDGAIGGRAWRRHGEADLWELDDATGAPDKEPVAVAATRPLGDGRRVKLLGFVVTPALRERGIGQRLLEDLSDALRGRGVLALVAAVPSDHAMAIVVVQRAGFRPSHVERASPDNDGRDVVWFDVEL
jgi:GNAT superfamily N-acetyltransferase